MPFDPYDQQNQEDDESVSTGAPDASSGGSTGGTSATASTPSQQSPSSFVSFDRYFNSNAGAANQMATGVAQTVGKQASDAQNNLNNAYSGFNQQVQAAGLAAPTITTSYAGNGHPDTTYSQGQYSGPAGFGLDASTDPIRKGLSDASATLGQTKDAAGLQTLLADRYNTNGQYTAGMNRFDAGLTNRAGASTFDDLRKQYAGLDSAFSDAQTRGDQAVAQAQAEVAARNAAAPGQAAAQQSAALAQWLKGQQAAADAEEKKQMGGTNAKGETIRNAKNAGKAGRTGSGVY